MYCNRPVILLVTFEKTCFEVGNGQQQLVMRVPLNGQCGTVQQVEFILSLLCQLIFIWQVCIFSIVARTLRQSHCCPAQRADYAGHRQQRAG